MHRPSSKKRQQRRNIGRFQPGGTGPEYTVEVRRGKTSLKIIEGGRHTATVYLEKKTFDDGSGRWIPTRIQYFHSDWRASERNQYGSFKLYETIRDDIAVPLSSFADKLYGA